MAAGNRKHECSEIVARSLVKVKLDPIAFLNLVAQVAIQSGVVQPGLALCCKEGRCRHNTFIVGFNVDPAQSKVRLLAERQKFLSTEPFDLSGADAEKAATVPWYRSGSSHCV